MRPLLVIVLMWAPAVPAAFLLLRANPGGRNYAFIAGSAFLVGTVLAAVSVPLAWFLFGTIRPLVLVGIHLGLAAAAAAASWYAPSAPGREDVSAEVRGTRPGTSFGWALSAAAFAWLGARFWLLFREATSKPLLAWDAWELWGAKAKVWTMTGELVAFHLPVAVGRMPIPEGYFASTKHPDLLPWLLTWFSTLCGGWDERVFGYLYVALVLAICLCAYGLVRALTRNPALAALAATALGTLPYLNAQVALPGYADIWIAAYFGFGAMLLALFARRPLRPPVLALLGMAAVTCIFVKSTGLIWAGILLGGLVVSIGPRLRWAAYATLAALVVFVALATPGEIWLPLKMRHWTLEFTDVTNSLLRVLLAFRDWNVLWWVVGAATLTRVVWPVKERFLHPLDVMLVASLVVLLTGFYYSGLSFWVTNYTGVNRGLLPLAPLALVWSVLSLERVSRRSVPGAAREE